MIVIDEASRVGDGMYDALRPMLAVSNGDLWMMSTPDGKQGFFYDTWQHGGEHWHRVSVQATECARISAEFLEEQRREMDAARFAQDYLCEFTGSGSSGGSIARRWRNNGTGDFVISYFRHGFGNWQAILAHSLKMKLDAVLH
jgi:hypothetical protein